MLAIIPPDSSRDQKISCLLRSPFFNLSNHLHGSHLLCIPCRPKQRAGTNIFENRQVGEMLNKKSSLLAKVKKLSNEEQSCPSYYWKYCTRIHGKNVNNENSRKRKYLSKIED